MIKSIFWANIQNDRSNALVFDYALSVWIHVLGYSTLVYRSFSLFFFLILLIIALELQQQNNKFSVFLVLLILSNSLLSRYNFECRTYLFTTALSLLSTLVLFNYLKSRKRKLLFLYFILVGLSLFSHYLVIVVFIWHFFIFMYNSTATERKKLVLSYMVFSAAILAVLFFIDQQTGFITSLLNANKNISLSSEYSNHFRTFSMANLITGLVQVLTQQFGLSLQSIFQIRYFAILLIIPFFLIYKQAALLKKQVNVKFLSLICIHLLFLSLVSLLSGNTTIFQLSYSIFVLPYYLLYLAELTDQKGGINPRLLLFIKTLIVIVGCVNIAGSVL